MSVMQLSASGRIACGGYFLDMYGGRPAAAIEAVHPTGVPSPPPLASWSQFPTIRRIRHDSEQQRSNANMHAAGEHVAISFFHASSVSSREMFFALGLFRCDTWALQWAVRADSITSGKSVCEVCCLCAHTVAFLVENKGPTNGKSSKKELYIATKADVPRMTKQENRQWRSFLADARLVVTGFESEGLCGIQALSARQFLLVTGAGRLVCITVSIEPQVEVQSTEMALISLDDVAGKSRKSIPYKLAVSSGAGNSSELRYVAVFASGARTCHVVGLVAEGNEAVSKPQVISIPEGAAIERVEFAGPHILLVTLFYADTKSFALSFTCLVPPESPSGTSFSCVSFDAIYMTAHRVPVMTMFNPEKDMHIVVVDRRHCGEGNTRKDSHKCNNNSNNKQNDFWWTHLEYAELPLQEGPYTREVFQSATWHSLPEPFHTHIPMWGGEGGNHKEVGGDDREEDSEDAAADYQLELGMLNQRGSGGLWEQVRLHYPLAARASSPAAQKSGITVEDNSDVSVTVLAIETAPFVHARLVKQWHNAARGLKVLLDSQCNNCTVAGLPSFAIAWNPQHMRRALRLFTQDGLRLLFTRVAVALHSSAQQENAATLFYGSSATAVTDIALQIITLSRQVGAHLRKEDVEVVVRLLRASRAVGHSIVNSTSRSKLLLESAVRSRMANHVLSVENKRTNGFGDNSGDAHGNEEEGVTFYNLPNEMRVERALRVRYAPNAWAQQLLAKRSDHATAVTGAIQHLKAIAPLLQQQQQQQQGQRGEERETEESNPHNGKERGVVLLPDWLVLGQRAHPDSAFTEYESVLLHTSNCS